jgi:beta-mannosidase
VHGSPPRVDNPAVTADLLDGALWRCGSTAPGLAGDPGALHDNRIEWIEAIVPGTAAAALRAAGRWSWGADDRARLDGSDWWFVAGFDADPDDGPWRLELDGIATFADVWLNGEHVLHSENMFVGQAVPLERLEPANELAIRCAALDAAVVPKRPRARWKSRLVRSQSLRFQRTALLGRMPGCSAWGAPVGPWRPVRLQRRPLIEASTLRVRVEGADGGSVSARIELSAEVGTAVLCVGDQRAQLTPGPALVEGSVELAQVERWWPHTHGAQPLYDVAVELDGERHDLGRVGFRTIAVERGDGAFTLEVNGVRVFCRGATWGAPDQVSFAATRAEIRASLERARDAGMNMLRVPGYTAYEGPPFWELCDELGLLVWQDCMLASTDPPETEEFAAAIVEEVRCVFGELAPHPALALACGSAETYQQAAMYGLAPAGYRSAILEQTIPQTLAEIAPELCYLPSAPSGGDPPFTPDAGVAHYFGVGAFLRPPADARLAGLRFAGECLAFATPPEPVTIREVFGDESLAGHDPLWKRGVVRDGGASWDFEDVTNHYVRELFGVDPLTVRYSDPDHALDLQRASVCELMGGAMAEWRRPKSTCDGALVLCWQDAWPGAGWGLLDGLGRPKAPLHVLRRALAPTALLLIDEGLAGLRIHVLNDGPEPLAGRVLVRVFNAAAAEVEHAAAEVELQPHGALELNAETLLGGFRDLTRAYRFGPPAHDVVEVALLDREGRAVAIAHHLPGGPARPRLADIGLRARAREGAAGRWELTVETGLFAQYVAVDAGEHEPSDSWFHLAPGSAVTLALSGAGRPSGVVRALNAHQVPIGIEVPI